MYMKKEFLIKICMQTILLLLLTSSSLYSAEGEVTSSKVEAKYKLLSQLKDKNPTPRNVLSCGIELDHHGINPFLNKYMSVPNDYIYFTPSIFGLREMKELRYYKSSNFDKKPDYRLHKKGLFHKDDLIYRWKREFKASNIIVNYLIDVNRKKTTEAFSDLGERESNLLQSFLAILDETRNGWEVLSFCRVLVVSSWGVRNKKMWIKQKILGEEFFLDVSGMKNVTNGMFLQSEKIRNFVQSDGPGC